MSGPQPHTPMYDADGGLPSGAFLGPYEILDRIARGGMAEVYLARRRGAGGFSKLLAIKRVLPHHASDPAFARMFTNEARIAAELDHANIAHVVDFGVAGKDHYLVMEYVHGVDVRTLQKKLGPGTPFPLNAALAIVLGVAAGLHHAHGLVGPDGAPLGLVHRDVSPSNIIVGHTGDVKIVDFGIAKATESTTATKTGTLKGKIPYMSPEHCRGEGVDRRSDVYAIGILLYELTTGHRVFWAENEFALLAEVGRGQFSPPSRWMPDYPPALEAIVLKALSHDRGGRYASALSLQRALEAFASEHKITPTSSALRGLMQEMFGDVAHRGRTPGGVAAPRHGSQLQPAITFDSQHVAAISEKGRGPWPRRIGGALVVAASATAGWTAASMSSDDERSPASVSAPAPSGKTDIERAPAAADRPPAPLPPKDETPAKVRLPEPAAAPAAAPPRNARRSTAKRRGGAGRKRPDAAPTIDDVFKPPSKRSAPR